MRSCSRRKITTTRTRTHSCKCASQLPRPTSSSKSHFYLKRLSCFKRQRLKKISFQTSQLKMLSTSKLLSITMTITRGQQTRFILSIWWVSSNTSKRVQYLWSPSLSAAQALQWCSNYHSTSPSQSISLGEILDRWLFLESQVVLVLEFHLITPSMMELEKNNNLELWSTSLAWSLMKNMCLLQVVTLLTEFVSMALVKLLMKL